MSKITRIGAAIYLAFNLGGCVAYPGGYSYGYAPAPAYVDPYATAAVAGIVGLGVGAFIVGNGGGGYYRGGYYGHGGGYRGNHGNPYYHRGGPHGGPGGGRRH